MRIKVDISDKIKRNPNAAKIIQKLTNDIAQLVKSEAVKNTPVDTSRLKDSYVVKPANVEDGYAAVVANNTSYADFVEYGHRGVYVPTMGKTLHLDTHYTEGRYMLTTAEQNVARIAPNFIKTNFEKMLKAEIL